MLHALIYHGFPIKTFVGRFERQLFHQIANQIDEKFDQQKNLLINGTWLNWDFQNTLEDLLTHYQPANVFIASMADPWFRHMDQWAYNKFPQSQIYFFGNVDNFLHFNMWSIYCHQQFPAYDDKMLALSPAAGKLFLCHQNKKNRYRDAITKEITECGLLDIGYLTYWHKRIGPLDLDDDEKDALTKLNLYPDSLGSLAVWADCLINIVSETEYSPDQHVFMSEKTWKPIIGGRPFMINGDPMIYNRLKQYGFKTFDQWFPVQDLEKSTSEIDTAKIISRTLEMFRDQKNSLQDLYQDMLPDIQYNRNRFFEFVKEQQNKIDTLFDAYETNSGVERIN